MPKQEDLVWYLGYGSNLNRQRFLCYIIGGRPTHGKRSNPGCTDKSLPIEDRPYKIPYGLHFGLPDGMTGTDNWGAGGVAFIDIHTGKNNPTLARIWKITADQYEEIRTQEGRGWYNKELLLGELEEAPIKTITHDTRYQNLLAPSGPYERTIIEGLMETFDMSYEDARTYLNERYLEK